MKQGKKKFEFHLSHLEQHLIAAAISADAAAYMFASNTRAPLFMLEALSKMYDGIYDNKIFKNLQEEFKNLEDVLGAIDYYNSYAEEFSGNNAIPGFIVDFLNSKKTEKLLLLNNQLKENNWIDGSFTRINKIRKKLEKVDWQKERKEIRGIKKVFEKDIHEIYSFYKSANGKFNQLEDQVHELRRKLRWLSIYAQALQGAVQLKDPQATDAALNKYMTPDILESPFNKLPPPGDHSYILFLEKDKFLALSWIIEALGHLKDRGLAIHAAEDAFKNVKGPEIDSHALNSLAAPGESIEAILLKASNICKDFFEDKILINMVNEIEKMNE